MSSLASIGTWNAPGDCEPANDLAIERAVAKAGVLTASERKLASELIEAFMANVVRVEAAR